MKNLEKRLTQTTKRSSDIKWKFLLLLIITITVLLFLSITTTGDFAPGGVLTRYNRFYYINNLKLFCENQNISPSSGKPSPPTELNRSRIAVCLVGGARRFELTGPSIIEKILEEYPNADLYLNSPLDSNSYKFSLLKTAPRIAAIRVFKPEKIPESTSAVRVLTADNSPNGIQGLLQYFNLVEGCLTMIKSYQQQNDFTYNWIVRTRVDGYWSDRLLPNMFIPGKYVVPSGTSYGGLNDRFGVGDFETSVVALSRLSMIPELELAGYHKQNSESAFKAQLRIRNVTHHTKRIPFCVVSDRTYNFPPDKSGVPVATLSSKGPLSGVKCRPCTSRFSEQWSADIVNRMSRRWSWTESKNGTLQLCDGHSRWEDGWEEIFDGVAGKKFAEVRKRVMSMSFDVCVADFEYMKKRSAVWDVPPPEELCQAVG